MRIAALATAAAVLLSTATPAHADPLVGAGLPPLPGDRSSAATGLNEAGTAIGYSVRVDPATGTRTETPVRWSPDGAVTRLPLPRGNTDTEVRTNAINDAGTIVGDTRDSREPHALRWDTDGTVTPLAPLAGDAGTHASHLTADGTAYGWSHNGFGTLHAVRWGRDGVPTRLEVPAGAESRTSEVKDVGGAQVVGYLHDATGRAFSVRWDAAGRYHPLDPPVSADRVNASGVITGSSGRDGVVLEPDGTVISLGPNVLTTGINSAGRVIGDHEPNLPRRAPRTWSPDGTPTVLPVLGTDEFGFADDINDAGVIVGQSTTWTGCCSAKGRAVRWNPDFTVVPLLGPTGYTASSAFAVNERGTVVGNSYGTDGGRAVIWRG
ncbi:hypothetical protein [Actinosynnema sp. NPDC020468]|uniref:hypothetical protein n=1 Tax=Actinosynnema sp. NPDC020468 TaxID=3154488 RepID=UPI0033C65638